MSPTGFVIFVIVVVAVVVLASISLSKSRGAPSGGRTCPGCGTTQPHHARFCRKCGKTL
jgi:hypothetical protein